jgi:DNA repair photolyase
MPLIYQPKGRAREYAALALNIYRGCNHGCLYCYVPNATVKTRAEFSTVCPRSNYLAQLEREAEALSKEHEPILLCFSCDPYPAIYGDLALYSRKTIEILKKHGHSFQVLTKGGYRALRDLDLYGPGDKFATTLTLLDDAQSQIWEEGAASPDERMDTLRQFHEAGIETWVSLEPVLNPQSVLEIIRRTHEYVDLYKVGKLNYQSKADPRANALAERIDWAEFGRQAIELLEGLEKQFYIKDDLMTYLTREPQP